MHTVCSLNKRVKYDIGNKRISSRTLLGVR
jgi:hypothetical protein